MSSFLTYRENGEHHDPSRGLRATSPPFLPLCISRAAFPGCCLHCSSVLLPEVMHRLLCRSQGYFSDTAKHIRPPLAPRLGGNFHLTSIPASSPQHTPDYSRTSSRGFSGRRNAPPDAPRRLRGDAISGNACTRRPNGHRLWLRLRKRATPARRCRSGHFGNRHFHFSMFPIAFNCVSDGNARTRYRGG